VSFHRQLLADYSAMLNGHRSNERCVYNGLFVIDEKPTSAIDGGYVDRKPIGKPKMITLSQNFPKLTMDARCTPSRYVPGAPNNSHVP
jgi:hypothetical protein